MTPNEAPATTNPYRLSSAHGQQRSASVGVAGYCGSVRADWKCDARSCEAWLARGSLGSSAITFDTKSAIDASTSACVALEYVLAPAGAFALKNLESGEQVSVPRAELAQKIQSGN